MTAKNALSLSLLDQQGKRNERRRYAPSIVIGHSLIPRSAAPTARAAPTRVRGAPQDLSHGMQGRPCLVHRVLYAMSFNFYFSGIASKVEADCLRAAGVRHVLVDPTDLPNATGFAHIALDSGAYRSWKTGTPVDIEAYKALARCGQFAWHVAPDVIGDPQATRQRWLEHRQPRMVPVWQYGAPKELLLDYLDEAPLVAIGGLVPLMREKNDAMFKDIAALCERYPRRLHLLGANWVRVLNELHRVAASMDTSKWLDAARYGVCFFIHDRTRKLHVAPAAAIGLGHLSREERLVTSARVMDSYLNGASLAEAA